MSLELKILLLLLMKICIPNVRCEKNYHRSVSCSVASMQELLETESIGITYMENYLVQLQHKIDTIESSLELLRQENNKSMIDEKKYLSDPINAFSLIHRLTFDWYAWNEFINEPIVFEGFENIESHLYEMPTVTEFLEAVDSIYRLQHLHGFTSNNMANGLLNGSQYDIRFSSGDSFLVAQGMFVQSHYQKANEWIEEALRSYEEDPLDNILQSNERDLIALYAEIQMKLGDATAAFEALDNALTGDPFNMKINQQYNEMELTFDEYDEYDEEEPKGNATERKLNTLCHHGLPPKVSKLHCRLLKEVNDFVRLAPFKMEELSLHPYIMLFYDVLSDKEILEVKELASSKLERASGVSKDGKRSIVGNFRTSKLSWLWDDETETVMQITKRISDMTGFNLSNSEPFQVVNYGIAGHYSFHYDFFHSEEHPDTRTVREKGDRIATVLFYMSDVADGGETIFPLINTIVKPQKGTAILWYNLDHEGNADYQTGHIACPVIVGSKWVVTKWIRERNQFRLLAL